MNNKKRIVAVLHLLPSSGYGQQTLPDPVKFDVTEEVVKMGREEALELTDDDSNTDSLKDYCPEEWVQDWEGPFWVEVEQSIREYFDE